MHILENGKSTILLDCGIKYDSYVQKYLKNINLDGILITHEHGDHIRGCRDISLNKDTYFYSMKETLDKINVPEFMKREKEAYKLFKIGTFLIVPFEVKHDAVHPVNYLIKDEVSGSQLLYITDTGYIDNFEFKDIDYILVECNFDEEWYSEEEISKLNEEDAKIKIFRGKRLLSKEGHLSIQKTIQFLKRTINHNTKKIILCHVSSNYDKYLNFENRVKAELQFDNVIALNPKIKMLRQAVITKLHEEKEVIPFE